MVIYRMLYIARYSLIILLGSVINLIILKKYPKISFAFRAILSAVISLVILFGMDKFYFVLHPLDMYYPEAKIATVDYDNPKVKEITYNVDIYNRTHKDVDVIITFTREDSDLYPYIDLIPETYTSDKITIKANERYNYNSSFIIDSEDSRLINSYYLKMKAKYQKQ